MHLIFWLETLQFSPSSQKRNIIWSIWKWTNFPSNGSLSKHFYNIRKLHFLLHFAIMLPLQGLSIQIVKVIFIFLSSQHQVSPLVHLASPLWTNILVPLWCHLPHRNNIDNNRRYKPHIWESSNNIIMELHPHAPYAFNLLDQVTSE